MQRLSDIDKQLNAFGDMNISWYYGLARFLQSKYPEQHRKFTSADNAILHLVSYTNYFTTHANL